MKFVIQKVSEASVHVEGECIGRINRGFLVFVGIGKEDTKETADQYIKKMVSGSLRMQKERQTCLWPMWAGRCF